MIAKKWKHLKDCYRKSQAKKRGKSGDSAGSIPKKWKYEDEMGFLLPNLKERPQQSNINAPSDDSINTQNENVEDEGGEGSTGTQDAFDDTATLSPRSEIVLTPSFSNASTISKPNRRPKPEVKSAEILQKFLENKEKRKKSDHLTKFFESAEETTRSLPPDLQVEIKHRISTVLYEFEMKAIARSTLNADMISNTTSTSPNDVVNNSALASSEYSVIIDNNTLYTNL